MVKKRIHNFGKGVRKIPTVKKDMIQEVQQNKIGLTAMRMTANTSLIIDVHLDLSQNDIYLTAMRMTGNTTRVDIHQNIQQKDICLTAMRTTTNRIFVDLNQELSDNQIRLTVMRIAGTKSLTEIVPEIFFKNVKSLMERNGLDVPDIITYLSRTRITRRNWKKSL